MAAARAPVEVPDPHCRCQWLHMPMLITFAPRSSEVDAANRALLEEIPASIRARPSIVTVRVEGHSGMCPEEYGDQALSEARAASVRDELVSLGVPAALLRIVGYATTQPRKVGWPRSKEQAELCDPSAPGYREVTFERRVEFSIRECTTEAAGGPRACPDQPVLPDPYLWAPGTRPGIDVPREP